MRRCFMSLLAGGLLLVLCACGASKQIVGTWESDGTWEIQGEQVFFEGADTLTFDEDGTGTLEITTGEGTRAETAFTYKLTDDTLTLTSGEMSVGIGYTLKGDTLRIETGGDTCADFTRVK